MSTGPAVTMQELELEAAELLPARETLSSSARAGSGNTGQSGLVNVSAANGSFNNVVSAGGHHSPGGASGSGGGNTEQTGLVNVSAANGSFNNDVSAGGHHSPGGSGGDGSTEQTGLVNVSAANGSFNNDVSTGSGNTG